MTQPANRDDDLRGDDPYATWDAAYVLGSLSGNERREFEAHLATCPRCSAAVAELSGIPALLAQLTAEEVEALDDPATEAPPLRPEVLDTLLQKVEWRRRRTRRFSVITLAAAAAVLAVALVVGILPGIRVAGWRRRTDGFRRDDEQGRPDADQRHHHSDRIRLGHPDRHGLHVRRLCEPRPGDDGEPGDGPVWTTTELRARSRPGSA